MRSCTVTVGTPTRGNQLTSLARGVIRHKLLSLLQPVGDHEKVRVSELAPGLGLRSLDLESWRRSVEKAAIVFAENESSCWGESVEKLLNDRDKVRERTDGSEGRCMKGAKQPASAATVLVSGPSLSISS